MKADDLVLVTNDYRVIALQKANGAQVWETTLVASFFKPSLPFIALVMDETGVYASTNHEVFCLDLSTGQILWRQELAARKWVKGRGISSITLAGAYTSLSSAPSARIKEMNQSQYPD